MAEKQANPWTFRPGDELGERIDAWAVRHGLARNAALRELLARGLESGPVKKGDVRSEGFEPRKDTWDPRFSAKKREK